MWLAITDNRATDHQFCDNLGDFAFYIESYKSGVKKFQQSFDAKYPALMARGKTVDDLMDLLMYGYFTAGDHVLTKYMKNKQDEYVESHAHIHNLIHEGLMAILMANYNYLVQKWGGKSIEVEKIVALFVGVDSFKGELKLAKM